MFHPAVCISCNFWLVCEWVFGLFASKTSLTFPKSDRPENAALTVNTWSKTLKFNSQKSKPDNTPGAMYGMWTNIPEC